MAATDLVPCFLTGQDYRWERPAEVKTRAEVREFKKLKLGKFVESGKIFLFFKRVEQAVKNLWDGPKGIGNLIPFARLHSLGEKLHYEIPHAGDRGMRRYGLYSRRDEKGIPQLESRELHVSSRNLFAKQPIPAVRLAV